MNGDEFITWCIQANLIKKNEDYGIWDNSKLIANSFIDLYNKIELYKSYIYNTTPYRFERRIYGVDWAADLCTLLGAMGLHLEPGDGTDELFIQLQVLITRLAELECQLTSLQYDT